MKSLRFALTLVAAIGLALPSSVNAAIYCERYENRYVSYYPDCACNACGGWASFSCTECADTTTGEACHADAKKQLCPSVRQPM